LSHLPSISIVVPNFNAASTLEATLESLFDQGYPGLEVVVCDGGSTDGSVEIIRRFAPRLRWWVSEKDRGQAHAINKGFARCTGEVVNWLCSDDRLTPGALRRVGQYLAEHAEVDAVVGRSRLTHTNSTWERLLAPKPDDLEVMACRNSIPQPSCFYRRRLLDRDPPLDESYHYTMDTELWLYFLSRGARFGFIDDVLSVYQLSETNKTSTGGEKITRELERLYKAYVRERVPLTFWQRYLRHPLERLKRRSPAPVARHLIGPTQRLIERGLGKFYGFTRVHAMDWGWTLPH
jgi:glycosyltransferase involved in cell wall biosynthesis